MSFAEVDVVPTQATNRKRKRRRLMVKITPWKDVYEWQSVAHGLRGGLDFIHDSGRIVALANVPQSTTDDLQRALKTLEVWKARSSNALLPHAIESSYVLAQLLLEDASTTQSPDPIHNNHLNSSTNILLQLAYATALLRSVNGLADALQQHRRVAAPVSQLCTAMGLPLWIVDLRHDTSHNALPWIPQLRLAAVTLLGFFLEKYWNSSPRLSTTNRIELLDRATQVLRKFIVSQENRGHGQDPESEHPSCERDGDNEDGGVEKEIDELNSGGDDTDDDNDWLVDNYFAALAQRPSEKKHSHYNQLVLMTSTNLDSQTLLEKKDNVEKLKLVSLTTTMDSLKTLPQDVVYQVVLTYYVWGDGDAVGLLQSSDAEDVYQPLLESLCRTWPGLVPATLIHAVECRLTLEEASSAAKIDNTIHDIGVDGSRCPFAHWMRRNHVFLHSYKTEIPMRSLCARLEPANEIRKALEEIFPSEAVRDSAMTVEKQSGGGLVNPGSNWSLVENWETCTIGCLPGHMHTAL